MKKFLKVSLASILSMSLLACGTSDADKAKASVNTYLKSIKNGDYETVSSVLTSDLSDSFDSTLSYYEEIIDEYDLSDETLKSVQSLISKMLQLTCSDYKVGEVTEVSDTEYEVSATVTTISYDNLDITDFEEELSEKYNFDSIDYEDSTEAELYDQLILMSCSYTSELADYYMENGDKVDQDVTFTVVKENDNWLISEVH